MPQDSDNVKNDIQIPDLAELWKELYFNTEGDWAKTMRNFIGTETFVAMLDKTLEQYLSASKISRQQMDKLSEKGVFPSKKDVARVAELVISLEEKIDMMEFQLFGNFNKMTDSVIKLADFQGLLQSELSSIKTELHDLRQSIAETEPVSRKEKKALAETEKEAPKGKGARKKAAAQEAAKEALPEDTSKN